VGVGRCASAQYMPIAAMAFGCPTGVIRRLLTYVERYALCGIRSSA